MDLSYTRRIIDAIHNGELENGEFENFPIFNVQIPKTCSNVPTEILNPRNTWKDKVKKLKINMKFRIIL